MDRRLSVAIAVAAGLVSAWVFGVGVALWSDESEGGPAAAEWGVAVVAGLLAFGLVLAALWRIGDRGVTAEGPVGGSAEMRDRAEQT